jgi:alpha-D-ribose 1-methylphosphonate 5-triphosphate synthase subunit PhnI
MAMAWWTAYSQELGEDIRHAAQDEEFPFAHDNVEANGFVTPGCRTMSTSGTRSE